MSIESTKLQTIFSYLNESGIEHVLVGEDVAGLMESVEGDVDIVLNHTSMNSICEIIKVLCNDLGLKCVQILQHEQRAFSFLVAWFEEHGWHYLHLDFCDDYVRDARLLITAEELLEGRIKDGLSGFYIPSPEKNLLYYLLKKVDKGAIDKVQFRYLNKLLSECAEPMPPYLAQFWTTDRSTQVIEVLDGNDFDTFLHMIPALQRPLKLDLKPSFRRRIGELKRIVGRIIRPAGLFFTIYGPDGCGKSSVIEALKPMLLPVSRRTLEFHFRPFVGYPANDTVVTVPDPHGRKPRHPITSVLKLFYYVFDYIVGYILKIWLPKVRATAIVFDRYYDDLIVDPRRYCYGGPRFLLKWIRPLIPKPDIVFCLDAPADILQSRKQEVPFEETVRQREVYHDLVSNLRNGHVIDASQPLEQVVQDVQAIVLQYLAERTAKRLGTS